MIRIVRWTWTNWTFGVWYAKFGSRRHFGIDIGPFEVVWKDKYVPNRRIR